MDIRGEDIKDICSADLDYSDFNGKTFLVTGASGFIGSYIVDSLLELNRMGKTMDLKVIALARNKEKAETRFKRHLKRRDLSLMIQDVTKPIKLNHKVNIIHAASLASPKFYGIDPVGIFSANVLGTYNLLSLKPESFLLISSSEVYGGLPDEKMPVSEKVFGELDPFSVRACYSEGKRAAETLGLSWMHQFGTPVKVVRLFHSYGPGVDLDDGRVFADFVSCIVGNKNILLNSDGKDKRSFCYITDVVKGIFTVMIKGKCIPYNVGNDEQEISMICLAEMLIKMYPGKKLSVETKMKTEKNYIRSTRTRICPDTNLLRGLGWKPQVTLNAGFKRMVDSYE